jgi:hypothetical protein
LQVLEVKEEVRVAEVQSKVRRVLKINYFLSKTFNEKFQPAESSQGFTLLMEEEEEQEEEDEFFLSSPFPVEFFSLGYDAPKTSQGKIRKGSLIKKLRKIFTRSK